MSPENQWLEDVFNFLLKWSLFMRHVSFRGVYLFIAELTSSRLFVGPMVGEEEL